MVFGSENFEDFVGELQLASLHLPYYISPASPVYLAHISRISPPGELQLASLVSMVEGDEPSMKGIAHKQRKREVSCAAKLVELLP